MPDHSPDVTSADKRPLVVCLDDDPVLGPVFNAAAERAGARPLYFVKPEPFQNAVRDMAPVGVVLDQVMPDSTGPEMIMWLRGLPRPPRVLLVGGDPLYLESSTVLVRRSGLELTGSLRKPLSLKEFADAIADLLGPKPA